jgi:hypothetical protein
LSGWAAFASCSPANPPSTPAMPGGVLGLAEGVLESQRRGHVKVHRDGVAHDAPVNRR